MEHELHTGDMVFSPACEMLVPDDKQKKFTWVLPCVAYLRFFWYFRSGSTCLALDPTDSCYSN